MARDSFVHLHLHTGYLHSKNLTGPVAEWRETGRIARGKCHRTSYSKRGHLVREVHGQNEKEKRGRDISARIT